MGLFEAKLLYIPYNYPWVIGSLLLPSLVAQMVKNLTEIQKTEVRSLDQEDLLEKGMATHSIIPAWRIPWTEEPDGLQSMEIRLSDFHFHCVNRYSLCKMGYNDLFLPASPTKQ